MSNSSPTMHEKIRHKAKAGAYRNARALGYTPMDATREANEVARFIDRVVGRTVEGQPA